MSKTRWDRNRAARTQRWESDYAPFGGGLDQASSALNIKPGRLVQAVNVEEVFGEQGYRFVKGYERFDGRTRPSQANYFVQPFDAGNATISQGDTITNAPGTASGIVVSVTISSGSVGGGDAAGYIIGTTLSSSWADNDPIKVGGVQKATASDVTEVGSEAYSGHQTALTATRTYLRSLIAAPVGSGPIRGGCVFDDAVLVVRDVADGTSATMWKSTASGWQQLRGGMYPGVSYVFDVANFSGSPNDIRAYFVNGRDRPGGIRLDGVWEVTDAVYASEATSGDTETIGVGAVTFTINEGSRNYQAGDAITAWSMDNAAKYMAGTVTSYNAGLMQVVLNVTSVGGNGEIITGWNLGRSDFLDKPYLLCAHKDHMFWAYPGGQLQTSKLGDPTSIGGGTAAAFGIGAEMTGLMSIKGKALAVFTQNSVDIISGSSSTDWDKQPYSKTIGAVTSTIRYNDGNPIFLSGKGVTSLQATQAFGDVEAAIFSRDVRRTLDAFRSLVTGSRMALGNNQYRMYFSDGSCLRFTFRTGNAVVSPKDVSVTLSEYPDAPVCFWEGIINGQERMFFGTSDGYVMEEDVGTSFDGDAIFRALQLPFNHLKSPALDKVLHKMELEMRSAMAMTLYYRIVFDYDDSTSPVESGSFAAPGEGGRFDVDNFDQIYFDRPTNTRIELPVDGVGRNVSLRLWVESDFVDPVTFQGLMTYFTNLAVRP